MFRSRAGSCYSAGMTDASRRVSTNRAMMTAGPRFVGATARDRALFVNFFIRELTTRYLGSATGLAWALLHPLALLARLPFRVHDGVSRRELRRQELPAVRRRRALAVARGTGSARARDSQSRRLLGTHPQGRVPARDRRSMRPSARRSRCSSWVISWCSWRSRRSASRCASKGCSLRCRCGSCSRSR